MKTAYVGFEVSLNGQVGLIPFQSLLIPAITLQGYQFDMSMRPMGAPPNWATDVLFQARFGPQVTNPDFNAAGVIAGTQGYNLESNTFCVAILKNWAGTDGAGAGVNKSIVHPYLNIPVPANTALTFTVSHSGTPIDFEVAGILYYD